MRERIQAALVTFARSEWRQMGALPAAATTSPWAQDPEALLLATLEVARSDRRLLELTLDWMRFNERLISARRLRTLARGRDPVAAAAVAWLARRRKPADGALAAAGLAAPTPRGINSRAPDITAPINLAFRLREFLGVGARAEVVRCLLTRAPATTAGDVAHAAGYTPRNAYEALSSLAHARVIAMWSVGNEVRFGIDRDRWAAMLGVERWPDYCDWPHLLDALRTIVREPAADAATLLASTRAGFNAAGIVVHAGTTDPQATLEDALSRALALLEPRAV